MDGGYSMFHSIENPEKYLGFNRNGKPINYITNKFDKQCRKIFKRVTEDSSNGLSTSPTIDYEQTSSANNNNNNNINNSNHHHRHKSSTRIHQRTHSNRIETSKSRSTSPHTSSKRIKTQQHPVRHHHNEQPLRRYHTISNNKNLDSNDNMSSTKQLVNEDLNTIYVNNVNESKGKQTSTTHSRHLKKPTQSVSKLLKVEHNLDDDDQQGSSAQNNLGRDENNNNNNDSSNCTYSTKDVEDETDDKSFGGRKAVKGRNTAQANKCNNNNNNRRNRKNNENGRHSRKPSQKSSSHKNQQANP